MDASDFAINTIANALFARRSCSHNRDLDLADESAYIARMALNPAVISHLDAMRIGLSACSLPDDQRVLAVELLDRLKSLHDQGRLTNSIAFLAIESLVGIPEIAEQVTSLSNELLKHPIDRDDPPKSD
ncbi:hypothetical protein QTH90_06275 [Variovorax sp. J2P1-59]|uniref:hypothetical protein n=1 Tax=Variovorax flavidus TaxID=3053501 RepID=UPI0025759A88|nr:hypothetical protein [Variovorax sp. J2P1-59]MDM0073980.1 hypothetical protein [Variovorax sp. J2P1-59]